MLVYTAGHINYGGRVTDDWDRRCMMKILEGLYKKEVLDEEFAYSESGIYKQISPENELSVSLTQLKADIKLHKKQHQMCQRNNQQAYSHLLI